MKIKFVRMVTADVVKGNSLGDTYDRCFDRNSILECKLSPAGEKFSDLILLNGDIVIDVPTSAFLQYQ